LAALVLPKLGVEDIPPKVVLDVLLKPPKVVGAEVFKELLLLEEEVALKVNPVL